MDVFRLRNSVIQDYADYVRSFVNIRDNRLDQFVQQNFTDESLWPKPLIQMNPSFDFGGSVDSLIQSGLLNKECKKIFALKSNNDLIGRPLNLHKHQVEAIKAALRNENYVLTTGTGSGKSLSYIIPIVNHCIQNPQQKGIKAIVVYPMNALCNSQYGELEKFLSLGYGKNQEPVKFERYTGQEDQAHRDEIASNPPDILLTNYVMLELLLTRPFEKRLINAAQGLKFLVLDELHTYRGRQGADVAFLTRRVKEACQARDLICVGTSATMASGGTFDEQRKTIAQVASRLFGVDVRPTNVIGESLTRATNEIPNQSSEFLKKIQGNLAPSVIPNQFKEFIEAEMASWLESTFGLKNDETSGRLLRAKPIAISGPNGAAKKLSDLTGLDESLCAEKIQEWLLAGYACQANPETGTKPFAFRLHQFISRGDSVYSTLEDVANRQFSLTGQLFYPNDRKRHMFPLSFCRECGADYYSVWKVVDAETKAVSFKPRNLMDMGDEDKGQAGFLYQDSKIPWPEDPSDIISRLPEDWLEDVNGKLRIKSSSRAYVPGNVKIASDGQVHPDGSLFTYNSQPFRICQCCGVTYKARSGDSDFGRLATLATGGRSTATTILSMNAVKFLKKDASLEQHARKLLSFTDNRQDASLQSGHFNDFIEVSLLRAALYKAVHDAGSEGLAHEELAQKVFRAIGLSLDLYAREPGVQFAQRTETDKAFRNVLGYRIYRDLKRGWRVTSPNLEQCGLLRIEYSSLEEFCSSEDLWQESHAALAQANPHQRIKVVKALLDYLRRELAIDVDYLQPDFFERLQQQSMQRLRSPWAIDENERHESTPSVFPRARKPGDRMDNTFLSGRSGFGQFLGRSSTFPDYSNRHLQLKLTDKDEIIKDLFRILNGQYLVKTHDPIGGDSISGYQLSASAMNWHSADGKKAFHDQIRVPSLPENGGRTNPFFVNFYTKVAGECKGLEAREHTAQVPYEDREIREKDFGSAKLPVLFCSPTMELGVDIRQLNVVNMRNVPPTPANYAQRSGRAGRSGQPAFVLTYCSSGNSHDQYFFRQPDRMVAGAVTPPRLDLANEDLVKAHVHAVWLGETGVDLGKSLTDILDVDGVAPSLKILPSKLSDLSEPSVNVKAYHKSLSILETIRPELDQATWFTEDWLRLVLDQSILEFDEACDRWRSLFKAAKAQFAYHSEIIGDASRRESRDESKRLRSEAEKQLELLTDTKNVSQSDFYSYRYFASEGFLPGYSFPRLPLSAYIPARRRGKGRDEFLSRPRFLAISEFGPRSIIYHEGSRYIVNKVILPVGLATDGTNQARTLTTSVKQCTDCGYIHETSNSADNTNRCDHCNSLNLIRLEHLLRLQNVATKRHDRITSDEEERARSGFEIRSGVRFKKIGGVSRYQTAEVVGPDGPLLNLTYGDATDIWRINLGWRRRANKNRHGFVLDMEKGYWEKSEHIQDDQDHADSIGHKTERVVPYVEDRRNCLIIEPVEKLDSSTFASFQASIKKSIQTLYQLEDNELAAEPLPSTDDRRKILIYEAAEGGAGVLRQLLDKPSSFAELASESLQICHFDPDTGEDKRRAPGSAEDCEAACYDCLMSYNNQMDHELMDRQKLLQILTLLRESRVVASPTAKTYAEHLESLKAQCGSTLEADWLAHIAQHRLKLPVSAQKFFSQYQTRPDFTYDSDRIFIYIDGPHHDFPDRHARDQSLESDLDDAGILVIRFHHQADWDKIIARYPSTFGQPQ